MDLLCPHFRLTWYSGAYPSEAGARVLLDEDHLIDDGRGLDGDLAQLVQEARRIRGSTPAYYIRGQRKMTLTWEEVRRIADPAQALHTAVDAARALPGGTGWVRLDIPQAPAAYALSPAAVESAGWRHDPRRGLLRLRWQVHAGPAAALELDIPAGAVLDELSAALETEDGQNIELESAA